MAVLSEMKENLPFKARHLEDQGINIRDDAA